MKYRKLGRSDQEVSLIGLGTMTWGEQNTEAEAHAQIDMALDHGVNLVDAAEMYPVPPRPETQGRTETMIGNWIAKSGRRSSLFLTSKAAGPVRDPKRPSHIRNGQTSLNRKNLTEALEQSLQRLQTDYLDLYQLHWPDRTTETFGRKRYPWPDPEETVSILETLEVLDGFVKAGKVRFIGVSNETPWGLAQFLNQAEREGLTRVASIQNAYSLLCRSYENGLSEFSHLEQVSLLAYSPLAMGVLTGKYRDGARPAGARLTVYERFDRYNSPQAMRIANAYCDLAQAHGLSPATLALAWVNSRPFVASNLIGATNLSQLKENLDSVHVELSQEVLDEIDRLHEEQPNPGR